MQSMHILIVFCISLVIFGLVLKVKKKIVSCRFEFPAFIWPSKSLRLFICLFVCILKRNKSKRIIKNQIHTPTDPKKSKIIFISKGITTEINRFSIKKQAVLVAFCYLSLCYYHVECLLVLFP